jgi:hypothetical protein
MMTILTIYLIPSMEKKRTVVMQADIEYFGTPTKAISNMDRRGFTTKHFLLAVRTYMNLIKIS